MDTTLELTTLIDGRTRDWMDSVQQLIEAHYARLTLAAMCNVLVRDRDDPSREYAYRVGSHLCFVFPYAHREIVEDVCAAGLPYAPRDGAELTVFACRVGIAAVWSRPGGPPDAGFRLYPDEDPASDGLPVLLVPLAHFPPAILPSPSPFDLIEGRNRRRRHRVIGQISASPLAPDR